ncbi:CRISPR-associated endonuclease Cas1 [Caldichromatium japonicum]|uniref:CRISPR-associated endonuclease Cas1 n=1 Tax=Caldichromatium japonicum TaxID=2699430 RepID=UPI00248445AD|nr:CRISPR-associated endonuclease Cas1 [Caldichromatium japonicum]
MLLEESGRFKARLEGPVSGNILLRQDQHRQAHNALFVLEFARACMAGKIRNSRALLMRGAHESADPEESRALNRVADNLATSCRTDKEATDLDGLRGIEGEAASNYFGALNLIVKPHMRPVFQLNGRTRRHPLDRFNALLSFLYALLMNDCRSALESKVSALTSN